MKDNRNNYRSVKWGLVPAQDDIQFPIDRAQKVAVYGSTGSIGSSTLNILRSCSNRYSATALFAHSNRELFAKQLLEFQPEFAGLSDPESGSSFIREHRGSFRGEWLSPAEIQEFASSGTYDIQIGGIVGVEGILTTFPAFCSGKRVALANKESLVVGGEYFFEALRAKTHGWILPVDSEHSSLFRILHDRSPKTVQSVTITASGGPFWRMSESELLNVSVEEALRHPTWDMGTRITLDSATLMNKAFELIETRWLFGLQPSQIHAVIHPESNVHGVVTLVDGSHLVHVSPTSMMYPIQHALSFPIEDQMISFQRKEFRESAAVYSFHPCSSERYPAIQLAEEALSAGFGFSLRMYVANEIAAQEFLNRRFRFPEILRFIRFALERSALSSKVPFSDLKELVREERGLVMGLLGDFTKNV